MRLISTSPDMLINIILDLFPLSYVKSILRTVDGLEQRTRERVAQISRQTLRNIVSNFQRRLDKCLPRDGDIL